MKVTGSFRKKCFLCLPLLFLLLCLTGCHQCMELECSVSNLPEDLKLAVLVRDTLADRTGQPDFSDAAEEQLYAFRSEDGWVTATHLQGGYSRFGARGEYGRVLPECAAGDGDKTTGKEYAAFAEKVQTVRIAAFDSEGRLAGISGEISLLPPDTFYAVRKLQYDWESGETAYAEICERVWHGKTPSGWWITSALAANLIGIAAVFAIWAVCSFRKEKRCKWAEILLCCLGILPFLLADAFFVVIVRSPFFNLRTPASTFSSVIKDVTAPLLFTNPVLVFVIIAVVKCVRRKKPQTTEEKEEMI